MFGNQNPHAALFNTIGQAKMLDDIANKLGIGEHVVVIKEYTVKPHPKTQNRQIVELQTLIDESQPRAFPGCESVAHSAGEERGWAWFPGSDLYGYAEARAQKFLRAVGDSFGDMRSPAEIGISLIDPRQPGRGIRLRAAVAPVVAKGTRGPDGKLYNKSGKEVLVNQHGYRVDETGRVLLEVTWTPITQTKEDVAKYRAAIDAKYPLQTQPVPQQFQQPPQQPQGQFVPQGMQFALGQAQQFQQPQAPQPQVQFQVQQTQTAQPQTPTQPAPQGGFLGGTSAPGTGFNGQGGGGSPF